MTWYHLVIVVTVVILPVLITLFSKRLLGQAQNVGLALAILLLLALDSAAIRDIAKGSEADYGMEYTILAASLGVFVFLAVRWYAVFQKTRRAE